MNFDKPSPAPTTTSIYSFANFHLCSVNTALLRDKSCTTPRWARRVVHLSAVQKAPSWRPSNAHRFAHIVQKLNKEQLSEEESLFTQSQVQHRRWPPLLSVLCRDFETGRVGWGDIFRVDRKEASCVTWGDQRLLARNKVCGQGEGGAQSVFLVGCEEGVREFVGY